MRVRVCLCWLKELCTCMRTSAGEHVNKTLSGGHHAAACEHPRLRKKRRALGRVRITQGRVGLCERSLIQAVGSVGPCWWEGRGAAACTQVREGKGQGSARGTVRLERRCSKAFSQLFIQHGLAQQRVNEVKKSLEGPLPAINRAISIHRMWQAAKGVPLLTSLLFQGDSLLCSVSHLGSET